VIIEPVTMISETERWVVLELYKSCLVVLPRAQFIEGLRRGKAWRRASSMRARLAAQREGDTHDQ
jgi:hypothetical protein